MVKKNREILKLKTNRIFFLFEKSSPAFNFPVLCAKVGFFYLKISNVNNSMQENLTKKGLFSQYLKEEGRTYVPSAHSLPSHHPIINCRLCQTADETLDCMLFTYSSPIIKALVPRSDL